ncbi:uncharacterized protein LOC117831877 [Notolabrus celidotus]|uniref:uncharacterized protein LOC117831877 n=1 Tax=Notolabrus celidotus TaxID=1203425 RepID=UPI00148FD4C4|nr:uncharacterized protein LOC117831877 [Notolabrus celidotus]
MSLACSNTNTETRSLSAADQCRMMKMTRRVAWCCVALLFALSSVSAVKKLKSINDLKKINFGQSVPTHSLVLLHWFANQVIINDNNGIRLTFDPSTGDYCSHHYGNFEGLLDPPPRGHQYYTVGNLNQDTSVPLPPHVVNPPTLFNEGNRDRIIIRVRDQWIDQVYITQHYDNSDNLGTPYDPHHTYRITLSLLREIAKFSLSANHQTRTYLRNQIRGNVNVSDIQNVWGHLAILGLFLCVVMNSTVHYKEPSRPESRHNQEPSRPESRHNQEPRRPESRHNQEPRRPESRHNQKPSRPESRQNQKPRSSESRHNQKPRRPESRHNQEPRRSESRNYQEPHWPESWHINELNRNRESVSNHNLRSWICPCLGFVFVFIVIIIIIVMFLLVRFT